MMWVAIKGLVVLLSHFRLASVVYYGGKSSVDEVLCFVASC